MGGAESTGRSGNPSQLAGTPVSGRQMMKVCNITARTRPPRDLMSSHGIDVESLHISCAGSRPLTYGTAYAGLMVFSIGNVRTARRIRPGYIYVKESSEILSVANNEGQIHGKLLKSLFNVGPQECYDAGGRMVGFSIAPKNGQYTFRTTSRSLNVSNHGSADLDEFEDWYIRMALVRWAWHDYSMAAHARNFSLRDLQSFYDTVKA